MNKSQKINKIYLINLKPNIVLCDKNLKNLWFKKMIKIQIILKNIVFLVDNYKVILQNWI